MIDYGAITRGLASLAFCDVEPAPGFSMLLAFNSPLMSHASVRHEEAVVARDMWVLGLRSALLSGGYMWMAWTYQPAQSAGAQLRP